MVNVVYFDKDQFSRFMKGDIAVASPLFDRKCAYIQVFIPSEFVYSMNNEDKNPSDFGITKFPQLSMFVQKPEDADFQTRENFWLN